MSGGDTRAIFVFAFGFSDSGAAIRKLQQFEAWVPGHASGAVSVWRMERIELGVEPEPMIVVVDESGRAFTEFDWVPGVLSELDVGQAQAFVQRRLDAKRRSTGRIRHSYTWRSAPIVVDGGWRFPPPGRGWSW